MDEQLLTISSYAETALYEEVALSPKPGLVDRFSNGAHRDMDFQTFLASIQSLRPFFKEYLYLGLTHRGQPSLLFNSLRETGKMAETAMLKATKGINTHRLIVYGQRIPTVEQQPKESKLVTQSNQRYILFGTMGILLLVVIVIRLVYKEIKNKGDNKKN